MAIQKVNYDNKVAIIPPGNRVNQAWDADFNEIKSVVNQNADITTENVDNIENLNQRVFVLENPFSILIDGGVQETGSDIHIDAFSFSILLTTGAIVQNPFDFDYTFPPALVGNNRIDILYIDESANFGVAQGYESATNAVPPVLPVGTIEVRTVVISGIDGPVIFEPYNYMTKGLFSAQNYSFGNTPLVAANGGMIICNGTVSELLYVIFNAGSDFVGRDIQLQNSQATNIYVRHNSPTVPQQAAFVFENEQDLILRPGQFIEFALQPDYKLHFKGILAGTPAAGGSSNPTYAASLSQALSSQTSGVLIDTNEYVINNLNGGIPETFNITNGGTGYTFYSNNVYIGTGNGASLALDITTTNGQIVSISNGLGSGTGFSVNDEFTVEGGNSGAQIRVDAESGGVPTAFTILAPGDFYVYFTSGGSGFNFVTEIDTLLGVVQSITKNTLYGTPASYFPGDSMNIPYGNFDCTFDILTTSGDDFAGTGFQFLGVSFISNGVQPTSWTAGTEVINLTASAPIADIDFDDITTIEFEYVSANYYRMTSAAKFVDKMQLLTSIGASTGVFTFVKINDSRYDIFGPDNQMTDLAIHLEDYTNAGGGGGGGNVVTNLSYTPDANEGVVGNDNGTGFTILGATNLIAGLLTSALKIAYDSASAWVSTNGAAILAHVADVTGNPHAVTKGQVGLSNVTNDLQIPASEKGAANGVASLGGDGKVPADQLTSYNSLAAKTDPVDADLLSLMDSEDSNLLKSFSWLNLKTEIMDNFLPSSSFTKSIGSASLNFLRIRTQEIISNSNILILGCAGGSGVIELKTNSVPKGKIFANGNWVIQNGGTFVDDLTNTLQISGSAKATGITLSYIPKTTAYTLTQNDRTVEVTTAATQTLPTAVGITGKEFSIVNKTLVNITVNTTSSQTIGNLPTGNPTSVILSSGRSISVKSNGTGWTVSSDQVGAFGHYYMHNNATTTPVAAINTFYKVLGTTTAGTCSSGFTHANNRNTLTGLNGCYKITSIASLESGNANIVSFRIALNGVTQIQSNTKTVTNGSGKSENISCIDAIDLVATDYIEVFVANDTVNDILVTDLLVTIEKINK